MPRAVLPAQPGAGWPRRRCLAKSFRGTKTLAGVDVEVRRGEILGLLGPNGSGKSSFINVVSDHYLPTAGSVVFEGRELAGSAAHRIARSRISRTYQIPRPFGHQTVLDNVALAGMFRALHTRRNRCAAGHPKVEPVWRLERPATSAKGIDGRQAVEFLAMLQVLAQQRAATRGEGAGNVQ